MLFREEAHTIRNVAELLAATCKPETVAAIINGLYEVGDIHDSGSTDGDFSCHEADVADLLAERLIELVPAAADLQELC